MKELLEITGEDISKLDDADLRNLIGLLCEADYRQEGLSAKGITWSGHQDAPDGGLDVVVRHDLPPPYNSFIPKQISGFQVKKPDMPASAIIKEMRPMGKLRDEIKSLIENRGSYIIVSSGGSTSELALNRRLEAMKKAVAKENKAGNLSVEFMDRGKVASWVRFHPSYIFWVRNKIGKPIKGWQPYGNWSHSPNGIEDEYLIDDGLRIYDGIKNSESSISVEDGLKNLRNKLSQQGSSIRLTGLSGVGKTRLVQALFDNRLGENPLNPSWAIFTDISDGPSPDPKSMADQLIAGRIQGILIVDNCPPDLHRRLTQTCSRPSSRIALLTVEYDVRDDLPEETNVFRLEPASEGIIEQLIKRRYPNVSNLDARSIAEFSGGNSRVAIALANTLRKGETLSGFKDEELFERLFRQRHNSNSDLLISAEACSLVYSFEGMDVESDKSELNILGSLIGKSGVGLYRDVTALKARDLVQTRNVWRAILPHAIANRLAKRALNSLPKNILEATFQNAPERLLRSFTNRLGYLHDCSMAIEITNDWMSEDGILGSENGKFNSLGISMFRNLAPVSPEAALLLIENAANGLDGKIFTSRKNRYYYEFVRILKKIAYEPSLFLRSTEVICGFAMAEKPDERTNSTRDILKSMFYMYLSGTHAPIGERIKVIKKLLNSSISDENDLGALLIGAALTSWHFNSSGFHDFGARPRDYGYEPKTYAEVFNWHKEVVEVAYPIALSENDISEKIRRELANGLRGLITKAGMVEHLTEKIRQIHSKKAWQKGWFAIKSVLRYDRDKLNEETVSQLMDLEKYLKPTNILQLARAYATTEQHGYYSLEDDYDENEDLILVSQRINKKTIDIGISLVEDLDSLVKILPELVTTTNTRVYQLGEGLAQGCRDKAKIWDLIREQLELAQEDKQNLQIMLGFLNECSKTDKEFYDSTLNHILDYDEFLVQWFPWFQITSSIDKRGAERLESSLDNDQVKIFTYRNLGYGQTHKDIDDDGLACLLNKIRKKDGGSEVAIDILQMRFYRTAEEKKTHSTALIKTAFDTLATFPFEYNRNRNSMVDLAMSEIASTCLNGAYGLNTSHSISKNVACAISENRLYPNDFHRLLETLAKCQPKIFLDNFIGEDSPEEDYHLERMLSRDFEYFENPLNQISRKEILAWAEVNPKKRYPKITATSAGFQANPDSGLEWKPLVFEILDKAPNIQLVLDNLREKVYPRSWSGSLAEILGKRKGLFSSLFDHPNLEVKEWAKIASSDLDKAIEQHRESDRLERVQRFDSFE